MEQFEKKLALCIMDGIRRFGLHPPSEDAILESTDSGGPPFSKHNWHYDTRRFGLHPPSQNTESLLRGPGRRRTVVPG